MNRKSYLLLSTPLLIVLAIACVCSGSATTPTVISTTAPDQPTTAALDEPTAAVDPTSTTASASTYNVGDVIQVGDHTIVLNSAEVANSVLKANFTVENTGTSNITVSSLLSFVAKDNDGTQLEIEIFDCGTSFDGTVIVGDKLRGDLCWKVTAAPPFKIYYQSNFLDSSNIIVWVVSQ